MRVPMKENHLALAAVDFGGSTRRNWARSESEGSPEVPQQVQRPAQRQDSLLGRWRWAVPHGVCKDTYCGDPREK